MDAIALLSTVPNHRKRLGLLNYGSFSGTSMAAPFVSGTAVLVWASPYGTDNASVWARVENTAEAIPGTGQYWEYGRVNAFSAVKL